MLVLMFSRVVGASVLSSFRFWLMVDLTLSQVSGRTGLEAIPLMFIFPGCGAWP